MNCSYTVSVLFSGYSEPTSHGQKANCSCTLLKGPYKIIVDTMTPWDTDKLILALKEENCRPEDIDFVISTHGHSDHTGNNNLFLNATHIVGFAISHKDIYYDHAFSDGEPYKIDDFVSVIPTPGHTLDHVSVAVKNVANLGTVIVAGDLFESEEDLVDEQIWLRAGSEDPQKQRISRSFVLEIADWIVPGHGKIFKVNK